MKKLSIVLAVFTLMANGCGSEMQEEGPPDGVEAVQSALDIDLPLTPLSDPALSPPAIDVRYLIKSNQDYVIYLGHNAPSNVDFSKEWVVFYSAGPQPSGSSANIDRARFFSASGYDLYIYFRLVKAGPSCSGTTIPYALAKFPSPPLRPRRTRYQNSTVAGPCP
jgi:hypothetical protein